MTLSSGTTLGSFEISGLLGVGGMGEVYRARDTKLGREVAIKVLPEALAKDTERLARFEREAKLLAALNHPNIAGIHEFGSAETEGGGQGETTHFLVMELVEGQGFDERLSGRPMSVEDALPLFAQIADALENAHEHGIIHRDLKPANIKITKDGRVKLLDFGLAKAMQGGGAGVDSSPREGDTIGLDSAAEVLRTQKGHILGTPAYMAPEQARGEKVDKRVDIWAFGCCLYEALTGKRPFKGTNASDLIAEILKSEPDWDALPADTPPRIRNLLSRCLQKDTHRRTRDLGDVAHTIEDTITASASDADVVIDTAKQSSSAFRFVPWAVAAVAVIGLVFVLATRGGPDAKPSGKPIATSDTTIRSLAVLPFENLMGDEKKEYFVDGMTDTLTAELSKIRSIKVIARTSAMKFKNSEEPLAEIARQLGVDGLIEGSVQQFENEIRITAQLIDGRSGTHLWGENFEGTLAGVMKMQGEVAVAIADQIGAVLTPAERRGYAAAPDVNAEAYDLYLRGRNLVRSRKKENLAEAIKLFEQATRIDDTFALGFAGLAEAYARQFDYLYVSKAEVQDLARKHARRALELDDDLAEAHTAMGIVHFMFNPDWRACQRELVQAIKLNPGLAESKRVYGTWLTLMGRSEESLAYLNEAVALDPNSALSRSVRAFAYMLARRYDEALKDYRIALELDPEMPGALFWLSTLHMLMGRNDDAVKLDLRRAELFPQSAMIAADLAEPQALAGNTEPARSVLRKYASGELNKLIPRDSLVRLQLALGDTEGAFDLFDPRAFPPPSMWAARIDPRWDALRGDPRFWKIIEGLDLPPLPPEHPIFDQERAYIVRKAAREILAAQPKPVGRFIIELPPDRPLLFNHAGYDRPSLAVSNDGTRFVYAAQKDHTSQLYLRNLNAFDAHPIPDTDGAYYPFFSPDGEWIGFFTDEGLRKVSVTGGASVHLHPAPNVWGAMWAPDDTILFNPFGTSGFWRISAQGGEPDQAFTTLNLKMNDQAHNGPSVGPDDTTIFYSVWTGGSVANSRIEAVSLTETDAEPQVLLTGGSNPYYTSSGHLVYARANELVAVAMDPTTLELQTPVTVFTGLLADSHYETPQYALSPSGLLVYAAGDPPSTQFELVWVDRLGIESPITEKPGPYRDPDLSPDGRHIVYTNAANQNIWVYDIRRGTHTPLTSHPSEHGYASYSPDGKEIAFGSSREGIFNIFRIPSDGTGEPVSISETRYLRLYSTWAPDGASLVYTETQPETSFGLWTKSLDSAEEGTRFYDTPAAETLPSLSSSGWIAYQSDISGRAEIYVRRFIDGGAQFQVSNSGGKDPFWSSDGGELFYQSLDGDTLMSAKVSLAEGPGAPSLIFDKPNVEIWDIDSSGERFLGVRFPEVPPITRLHVVQNFFEELERLVPTGRSSRN